MISNLKYMRVFRLSINSSGLEVIKLEYSLKLKIKRNDWLLADNVSTSSQSLRFILSLRMNSSCMCFQ